MISFRRGFSLAELTVGLAILGLVMVLGMKGYGAFIQGVTAESQKIRSTEALRDFFAFLEAPLLHSGLGIPHQWDSDLFRISGIGIIPVWASWSKDVAVGNSTGGSFFRSVADGEWGNTLRILSAVPAGVAVVKDLAIEPGSFSELRLVGFWRVTSQNMGIHRPIQWLVFPPEDTPVFVRSWRLTNLGDQKSAIFAESAASRTCSLAWGMAAFHLYPLVLCAQNGNVYGNFQDQSGLQPLVAGIDSVSFCLESGHRLLRVRARSHDREEERCWVLRN